MREIVFKRNKEQLIYNEKTIWAWNKIRSLSNGKRGFGEVVYSSPFVGNPKPYDPQLFPLGRWEIFKPVKREDNYLAPYFIPTDAQQIVDTYELKNGQYFIKSGRQMDGDYGLHFSVSETTLGCIRIAEEKDLRDLVDWIKKTLDEGEPIYLIVQS